MSQAAQPSAPKHQAMPPNHQDVRLKCGSCKWFVQGFKGKTCQVTRAVQFETRACIEFQQAKKPIADAVQNDKFLLEMNKTLMIWSDATFKAIDAELRTFKIVVNDTLTDPLSYVEENKLAELGHKFHEIQVYQERLQELRYNLMDKNTELQTFAKDVQAYLFNEYRDVVQSLKNESERAAFFRAAAPHLSAAMDQMENLKAKMELGYQSMKDAHFSLGRKLDAILELFKSRTASVQNRSRHSG